MQAGVTTNFPAFKKALDLYVRVSRETVFDAVRNAMGDVAIEAEANTYYTSKEQIDKEFQGLPIKGEEKKRRYGDTRFVGQYKIINWQRKNRGLLPLGGSKFRKVSKFKIRPGQLFVEEKIIKRRQQPRNTGPSLGASRFMDGKYKKFLQMRKFSIGWLRFAWLAAAKSMGKKVKYDVDRIIAGGYGGGYISQINANTTEFAIFNNTGRIDARMPDGTPRSSSDIARADAIMTKGLEAGIQKVLYDPKKGLVPYISARLKRLWESPTNIVR